MQRHDAVFFFVETYQQAVFSHIFSNYEKNYGINEENLRFIF